MGEIEDNIFTVKLLEVILPEEFDLSEEICNQPTGISNNTVTNKEVDLSKLDHIFLVMTLVDQDLN